MFISPLLTPAAEDTFADYDDDKPPAHLPRSLTASVLEDLPRRFSALPQRAGGDRRQSAAPCLQQRQELYRRAQGGSEDSTTARPSSGSSSRAAAVTRRLSNIFARSSSSSAAVQTKPSSRRKSVAAHTTNPDAQYWGGGPGGGPGGGGGGGGGGVARRASLFAESIFKRRRERSKSLAPGSPMKRSSTSHALGSLAEAHDLELEERPPAFIGAVLPTSLAGRRATLAAFKDFRRSASTQANLSGLASLDPLPPDPLAKLGLYDSYYGPGVSEASFSSLGGGYGLPSVSSSSSSSAAAVDEAAFPPSSPQRRQQAGDPEKGGGRALRPARVGEVLADLRPLEEGAALELQRLAALLKVRALLCVRDGRRLLARLALPVLLALLAVGLSHALAALARPSSSSSSSSSPPLPRATPLPGKRTHLFGVERLMYRHQAGKNERALCG